MKTPIQAIHYLITMNKTAISKKKIGNLIFLADRYHVRKYGRLITNDTYVLDDNGLIGKEMRQILSSNFSTEEEKEMIEFYTKQTDKKIDTNFLMNELDFLSETDKEALDFVLTNFGNMNKKKLTETIFLYPEYTGLGLAKRTEVTAPYFFLKANYKNDPFDIIKQDVLDMSRELYIFGA